MATKRNRVTGNALQVLVVEDNRHMRALLRIVLRAMGILRIVECDDGSTALKKLASLKPDFIVTDLSMAPMDGLDFTRAVRRLPDPSLCVVPIIMVTGHTERRRVEAARDAGVNEILAKPISVAGLFERVEEIIYRPRPFVRSEGYCGPCRRRTTHDKPGYSGPWRRETDTEQRTIRIDTGPVKENPSKINKSTQASS